MIEASIRLLVALVTPWLLGYTVVNCLLRFRSIKCTCVSIGYGYFVGWAAVYSTILFATYIDNKLEINKICYALVLLTFVLHFISYRLKFNQYAFAPKLRITKSYRLPAFLLVLFIITRITSLGYELIMQPMFPWDAYTAWIPKAKLWYYMNELTQVVSFWEWRDKLDMPFKLYIHDSASEKELIPIIVLWMGIITNGWDEGIIFLPWLFAIIAFCIGFYGQTSLANTDPIKTGFLLFILFTLPILNTHIALAGYADLWLGLSFGLAVAAMYHWEKENNLYQLILFIAMTWICYITKSESGFIWSIILSFGFILVLLRITKTVIRISLTASVITFILLLNIGMNFEISDYILSISEKSISIPGIFMGNISHDYASRIMTIMNNLLIAQNWNILWYCLLFSIVCKRKEEGANLNPGIAFVIYSTTIVFLLYMVFKEFYSRPADTIINRALLHITPAYVFILCIIHATNQGQTTSIAQNGNNVLVYN